MTRILNLFPVHEVGGAENVILNLIRHRRSPEIEHSALILSEESGPLGHALTDLGVFWNQVPRGRMRQVHSLGKACFAIREFVQKVRPEVILANSPQGFLYARLATVGCKVPTALYYMSVPQTALFKNQPMDVLTRWLKPPLIFTASRSIQRTLEHWGLSGVETVYHGTPERSIDAEEQRSVTRQLEEHAIPADSPVVLLPGRLQPWKGQKILVNAFQSVLRNFPDAHAVCLGSALFGISRDYPEELISLIRARGLEARVHLIEHSPIRPWLERASIVVHASITADAFPNVCIEAMAARRALITNRLSGTAEILTSGKDALVIEPNEPDELAQSINTLLTDRALKDRIAEAGYRRYQEMCTPAHMVDRIETGLICLAKTGRTRS